jgi:hypothetical protein
MAILEIKETHSNKHQPVLENNQNQISSTKLKKIYQKLKPIPQQQYPFGYPRKSFFIFY